MSSKPAACSHRSRAHLLAVLALLCAALVPEGVDADASGIPQPERGRELLHLLRHDCGACHGLTLAGGLGPALLPQALRERPAEALVRTILDGRTGTAMPPWKAFIDDDEARWMVQMLIKGLPDGD